MPIRLNSRVVQSVCNTDKLMLNKMFLTKFCSGSLAHDNKECSFQYFILKVKR